MPRKCIATPIATNPAKGMLVAPPLNQAVRAFLANGIERPQAIRSMILAKYGYDPGAKQISRQKSKVHQEQRNAYVPHEVKFKHRETKAMNTTEMVELNRKAFNRIKFGEPLSKYEAILIAMMNDIEDHNTDAFCKRVLRVDLTSPKAVQ